MKFHSLKEKSAHRLIMMKLTLSVHLIWILLSSAEALKCYHKSWEPSWEDPTSCASPDEQCAGIAAVPDVQTRNGLQCFTCSNPLDTVCDTIVQCVGIQDRCFKGNLSLQGKTGPVLGCASANLCEGNIEGEKSLFSMPVQILSAPQCCGTSLCNSAPTFRLSVVPVLHHSTYTDKTCRTVQVRFPTPRVNLCSSVSVPDVQTRSGLQCFTCSGPQDTVCDTIVQCVGIEDRCFKTVLSVEGKTGPMLGCASANLCEGHTELEKSPHSLPSQLPSAPQCCGTSLCNSAPTFRLSVVPVLLSLVALSAN
ncbi:hypothetical protein L3Q82_026078 [Xyrichtys novacula]|uniref:UPAR/Ly6 domain-containing protein n=1 Tax=Xyrichtys novacula TaxID=13765 RepID=A0AAV1FGC3_XYRNO|nr:hypothetical protein L3Q82_026078 [Xyrichtys novacula]